MKRAALAIVVLSPVMALIGCGENTPAVSVRPLYNADEKSLVDPRLEGEWISPDLSEVGHEREIARHWKFVRENDHYAVEMHESEDQDKDKKDQDKKEQDKVDQYRVFLLQLGDKDFVDAMLTERTAAKVSIAASDIDEGLIAVHMIGRIWIEPDFLRLTLINSGWVKEHMPEDFRALQGATSVIVSPTAELRNFLIQHADDETVFSSPIYFCRPTTDCPMRVANDLATRKPNDVDALTGAAKIYMARKHYEKAAELLRHAVAIQPRDSGTHLYLALALADLRDFKGLHAELNAMSQLPNDDPAEWQNGLRESDAWAYFVEGNYQQCAKMLTGDTSSALPILLNYYSLLRLGHEKQAKKFLAKEAGRFSGAMQDQILLLNAQGRITDVKTNEMSDDDRATYFYVDGLSAIARGDEPAARKSLQAAVEIDSPITPLCAQIELEKLDKNRKPN